MDPSNHDEPTTDSLGLRGLLGLGSMLVGSVVVGTLIGWLVDNALDTSPAFTLAGIGVGIVGGLVGGWLQIRHFLG
jgi:F0F1-type ATP synthase assembly protein I